MERRRSCVAVLAVAGSLALVGGSARAVSHDEMTRAAIEAGAGQFAERFAAGDAAGIAALYSEEAKAFPPGGETASGQAAIRELWAGALAGVPGARIAITVDEVLSDGGYAIEVGRYTMTDAAGATLEQGKYVATWRREGEAWRVYREIWNTTPLPPAVPGDGDL